MTQTEFEIVRESERRKLTGLSRTQFWRLERTGLVPKRIQLGKKSVGWVRSELESWIKARMAARS